MRICLRKGICSLKKQFEVLGVSELSSDAEIKERFVHLTKALHPDNNPSKNNTEESYIKIKEAYHQIIKERSRAKPSDYLLKLIEEDKKFNVLINNISPSSNELKNYFRKGNLLNLEKLELKQSPQKFNNASLHMMKYARNKISRQINLKRKPTSNVIYILPLKVENTTIDPPIRLAEIESDDNVKLRLVYRTVCVIISIYGVLKLFNATFFPYLLNKENRDQEKEFINNHTLKRIRYENKQAL